MKSLWALVRGVQSKTPPALDVQYGYMNVVNGNAKILSADPNRVAVILSLDGGATVNIGFDDQVTSVSGMKLPTNADPVYINDDTLPGGAARAIYANAGASGPVVNYMTVTVIE